MKRLLHLGDLIEYFVIFWYFILSVLHSLGYYIKICMPMSLLNKGLFIEAEFNCLVTKVNKSYVRRDIDINSIFCSIIGCL